MAAPRTRAKTESAIRIRRADPTDLGAIDRIEQRSFTADRFPRRNLKRLLESPSALTLVAEKGGRAGGFAILLFRKGARVARLYSIAVDPVSRGAGVAGLLLSAAAKAARAEGADRLRLELRPSNTEAMRLYHRAGFTIFERKPGYYADGEDAVRMELALSAGQRATGAPRHER